MRPPQSAVIHPSPMAGTTTTEEAPAGAPGSEAHLHRPLPRVDIPLLRDQRRLVHAKRAAYAGSALVALVVACVVVVYSLRETTTAAATAPPVVSDHASKPPGGGEKPSVEAAALRPAEPPLPDPEPVNALGTPLPTTDRVSTDGATTRTLRQFGSAPGFRPAVMAAGCSDAEYDQLEGALASLMDFRRCRPEDRMVIERDEAGSLVLFEYHGSDPSLFFRAARDSDGKLQGERVSIPVDVESVAVGGTVRSSLGDAIVGTGLGRSLVNRLISAFDGKADFSTDTREGDEFRIIVDKESVQGQFHGYGAIHAVEYRGQRTGNLRAFWFSERDDSRGEFWDETGHAIQGGWLRTPCRYDRISSPFDPHRMHPILRRVQPHNGVDYAAGTGTPVWAASDGTVAFAGRRGANGNLVSLRHSGGFETHYAHLSRIARGLRRGDRVEQRQVIGYVGSTGRSTGPHLHFGLKHRGRYVDPMIHLNGPGRAMRSAALRRFRQKVRRLRARLEAIVVSRNRGANPPTVIDTNATAALHPEETTLTATGR